MTEVIVFVNREHVRAVNGFDARNHHRDNPDIIATYPEQGHLDRWRGMKIDRVIISDGCNRLAYYDGVGKYKEQFHKLVYALKMCMKPDGIWIEL